MVDREDSDIRVVPRREWYWHEPSDELFQEDRWKGGSDNFCFRAPDAPVKRLGDDCANYDNAIETFLGVLELDHSYTDLPDPLERPFLCWGLADVLDSSLSCDCGWRGLPSDDCPDCGDPFWVIGDSFLKFQGRAPRYTHRDFRSAYWWYPDLIKGA